MQTPPIHIKTEIMMDYTLMGVTDSLFSNKVDKRLGLIDYVKAIESEIDHKVEKYLLENQNNECLNSDEMNLKRAFLVERIESLLREQLEALKTIHPPKKYFYLFDSVRNNQHSISFLLLVCNLRLDNNAIEYFNQLK
jgi:hypothetical protein